uniref:histidine kinase n=1 Tax=Candidatus Kentrum sp. DK TaxID=2126562 RepID=A0A450SGM0_9GAMM|nr:MAG: Chaperone of endosialidase [Candidatus Kentron sp. DK]VFJ52225.1 MAG: Chaperone of endosialidase [Candidatus Kentron sp. DK]
MKIFQNIARPFLKRTIPLSAHPKFVENIKATDPKAVLEKLAGIPIQTWNYKWDDASVRHVGPMAQDFYGAFGLGNTDKAIFHMDAIGVCLASIQGLNQLIEEQGRRIAENEERIEENARRIERLQGGRG